MNKKEIEEFCRENNVEFIGNFYFHESDFCQVKENDFVIVWKQIVFKRKKK